VTLSGITKGVLRVKATDKEIPGHFMRMVSAVALPHSSVPCPNTSFSQKWGLRSRMTGS